MKAPAKTATKIVAPALEFFLNFKWTKPAIRTRILENELNIMSGLKLSKSMLNSLRYGSPVVFTLAMPMYPGAYRSRLMKVLKAI